VQNPCVAEPIAQLLLELINIPSESRNEQAIAEFVCEKMPVPLMYRHEETLLFETARRVGRPFVLLVGHLDTVPAQGNIPGKIKDGVVHGLGASDMKGGLAVMVELGRRLMDEEAEVHPAVDVGFLFFPREELSAAESPLPDLFNAVSRVSKADLVIVLEPTDNTIQAGCLGNMTAQIVVKGESAHSARPWLGKNAINLALERLSPLAGIPPTPVEVGGLTFREVLSLTTIQGGIAQNVIPDRVEATLNYRYAPNKSRQQAEAYLRELVGPDLKILSNSPPAHVAAQSTLVQQLRSTGEFGLEAKQAWTPVAEFAARGLDAINLGPGATQYAHRADEQVEIAELNRTLGALLRFVSIASID
jgi:succinyl-diaminopimelate desuccinylase